MPFAINGRISTDPIEGGVEISQEQYSAALAGLTAGKLITIDGGFAVTDPPAPEPEPDPEPEPVDATTLPLSRLTFWLAAAEIGVTKAGIRAHIEAMEEGVEKFQALAYLEEAQVYRRADPLLIAMAAAEGITEEQLDTLWVWAAQTYP